MRLFVVVGLSSSRTPFLTGGLLLFCLSVFTLRAQDWRQLGPWEYPYPLDSLDRSVKSAAGMGRVGVVRFLDGRRVVSTPFDRFRSIYEADSITSDYGAGLPAAGVADMAALPRHPEKLFAATGDPDAVLDPNGPGMNSEMAQSRGIYSSADAGKTWTGPVGKWYDTLGTWVPAFWDFPSYKICRRIVVSPSCPRQMLAIIQTSSYQRRKTDGYVYRSQDGGLTWRPVLYVPDGCFKDLEIDPVRPKIVYVGGRTVYLSTDFGKSWKSLQRSGLPPDSMVARCEIALSPSSPGRVYVLVNARDGKSNDLYLANSIREGFRKVASGAGSPPWRTALAVDSRNPSLIYYSAGNKVNRFEQVGTAWRSVYAGSGLHDDVHDLTPDPQGGMLYASTDGGLACSTDSGKTWRFLYRGLNVTEYWGLAAASRGDSLFILGGTQDAGTQVFRGSLNSGEFQCSTIRGGDGMKPWISAVRPDTWITTDGNNNLNYRTADAGRSWKLLAVPRGLTAEYVRPFVGTSDGHLLMTGYKDLYVSRDEGSTWQAAGIPMPAENKMSVIAMAMAQSDDRVWYVAYAQPTWSETVVAKLFLTNDAGATWKDISAGLKAAAWTSISCVVVDPKDARRVLVGFRGAGSIKVMASEDGGLIWKDISQGLPASADVNAMCFDERSGDLFAATHEGVWKLSVQNHSWTDFNGSLPRVYTSEIFLEPQQRVLLAGTHGAGLRLLALPR